MNAFLLLGLLALQAPATPPRDATPTAETYVIKGRVTDVTTGQPLRGVAISIRSSGEVEGLARGALTDDEGRWSFGQLPAGDYVLNHSKPGFTRVQGVRIYSPVHVSAQFPVRDLELVLARGGVITGRVTDPIGEPAVGVQVQAHRLLQGQLTWSSTQDTTDDRGEFRLFGLMPGEYAVSAMPPRHHGVPSHNPDVSVVQTYYPGTVNSGEAEPLVVAEQGLVTDLTFQLQTARTFVVTGEVITSSREIDHVNVSLNEDRPGYSSSRGSSLDEWSRGRNRFRITDVLPGQYTVSAHVRAKDGDEHGAVPVVVSDENVSVTIVTQGPTVVRGRVVTPSGPLRDAGALQVSASSTEPGRPDYAARPGRVRDDGTFELTTSVPSFHVHVFGRMAPTGWRVKEVRWRGERVDKDGITATGPVVDGVEVVVMESTSRLQGTARDATGAPMRQGTLVIVPADSEGDSPIWHRANISDGRFVSPLIPEGRYLVAAVSAVSPGEITPALVTQVRERGDSIELGEREQRTIAISVVIDAPR